MQQTMLKQVLFAAVFFGYFTVFTLALAYEAAPLSWTQQPSFVTEKSMQLNGMVNPGDMPDTYQWFEWGIVGRSEVYTTRSNHLRGGNQQYKTSATLIGLAPSTQYFFRQVSENSRGKDVGMTGYVTTKPLTTAVVPIALVRTEEAVFVDETFATLRGYVSPHGSTETEAWFEWGETTLLEHQTPHRRVGGGAAPFEARLTKLAPGTLYYFRAVAENTQGRSYGTLKVLLTRGTPPVTTTTGAATPTDSASTWEAPKDQYVPSPVRSSDGEGVSRSTTSTGSGGAYVVERHTSGLPIIRTPSDFFSSLFRKKSDTVPATPDEETETDHRAQAAAVATVDMPDYSGMLSGDRSVEVAVERAGDDDVSAHTPLEYRIAYAYRKEARATDARLKIVFPAHLIYIGDNTNNELLIESPSGGSMGAGGARTYVLPLGNLEKGSTRSVSIMGISTAGTTEAPDIIARLEYTDASGTHVVPSVRGALPDEAANMASVGSAGAKLLPHSFMGWIMYILLVAAAVIGVRLAREYYAKRKEELARADERDEQLHASSFFPNNEGTPGTLGFK